MHPLVSVIIGYRNEEKYIRCAVDSILRQSYKNIELLLIDDYSTDHSYERLQSYNDKRIRHIKKKRGEPQGVAVTKNLGVQMSAGEYVAIQDADDISHKKRIEEQMKIANSMPGKIIVGCNVNIFKDNIAKRTNLPVLHADIEKGFLSFYHRVRLIAGTLLAPRAAMTAYPMREKFKYMSDWDQLLRLWESGSYEFVNTEEALYDYYLRPQSSMTYSRERVSYNVFLRHCEERRKRKLNEYETLEEFSDSIKGITFESLIWRVFWAMKIIQHRLFT